jgi:hypothetical protein
MHNGGSEKMNNNKLKTTLLSAAVTVGLVMGGASAAAAHPAAPEKSGSPAAGSVNAGTANISTADMEDGLNVLMSIPDAVLMQGDAATQQWLQQNPGVSGSSNGVATMAADFWGCSGSIVLALGGVALPAAKILKIKKLMNELGGVTEAVRTMWGASFSYEKMQAAGGALGALGAELLGIAGIKEKCFN